MIGGIGNLRTPGIFFPMEVRAHVGTPLAANLAGKSRLDIRQPHVIWPSVAADRGPMAALVIRAINQQPANAGGAHLRESDLLAGKGGHALIEACSQALVESYI